MYKLSFVLFFWTISLSASELNILEKADSNERRGLFTAIHFGTGNSSAHSFQGNPINQNGYSLFTGMININFEVGYSFSHSLSLRTGLQNQILSLQFAYNNEEARFSGLRHQVPLSFRRYFEHVFGFNEAPFKLFADFGVYYAFNSDGNLIVGENEYSAAFDAGGLMVSVGLMFFENNRQGISIAYNQFADLIGSQAKIAGGYFTLGLQTNF
jgi:hypothetical protein